LTNSTTVLPNLECPPRYRTVPDGDPGWGDLAVDFANLYVCKAGERLYEWQEDVLRSWMLTKPFDEDTGYFNTYAAPTCGLEVPRQNGKSKKISVPRMLVGAIFKHEKIRYSAQRVDTMLELFAECVEIVGDPDDPKQRGRNRELFEFCRPKVSFVNGHQKITFADGGEIAFVSRSRDAGRGNTADVNIFDEAQTLTDQQLADSLPNNAAAQSGNPQTIFVGTPPSPERSDESGEAFSRVRRSGIDGAPGHCWHEWSVGEIGDVKDETRWYATNPSLGKSLLVSKLRDNLLKMTPLVFAIEHLCYWTEALKVEALDGEAWDAAVADKPADDEIAKRAVGIKFSPAGQVCASIALLKNDGTVHGELIAELPTSTSVSGLSSLIDWLTEHRDEIALITMDGKTGAGELYERLSAHKLPSGKKAFVPKALHLMKTTEVPTAATMVINGLTEGTLTHWEGDEVLNASAHAATKRKVGADGIGFGGDSCPIESYAAAVWAVRTTKRDPARKTRWVPC